MKKYAMEVIKLMCFDLVQKKEIDINSIVLEILKNAKDTSRSVEFGNTAIESLSEIIYAIPKVEELFIQQSEMVIHVGLPPSPSLYDLLQYDS